MPNIALNRNASASYSVQPYSPAKAFDGAASPLSRWVGSSPVGGSWPIWLAVDLGAPWWINRWVVRQMGAVGWPTTFNLANYMLQGSLDGVRWFTLDTVLNNTANVTDRGINPNKVRWVRAYVTKGLWCNNNVASIVDFEVYDAPNPPGLSWLELSSGSLSPAFTYAVTNYSATVGAGVDRITVTPTASAGTIQVNGEVVASGAASSPITLALGANTITVKVTSGAAVETYTVTVTKVVKSSALSGLVFTARGGTMQPAFSSAVVSYRATVAPNATSATVTPTAEDPAATILVNGVAVASGATSGVIPLQLGVTSIPIDVTAADGTSTKTYTIDVTR